MKPLKPPGYCVPVCLFAYNVKVKPGLENTSYAI